MIIRHFPIFAVLIPLLTAITLPIRKRKFNRYYKAELLVSVVLSLALSLVVLLEVSRTGGFKYSFGDWPGIIGVEFSINLVNSFMVFVILAVSTVIMIYSMRNIEFELMSEQYNHYYSLSYLLIFSMIAMVWTNDLFNMYVFMEILSLTACAIISIKRKRETLLASFKYLMLSTIGSVSILLGIALLYMVTGYLNMDAVAKSISTVWELYPKNLLISLGFILSGLGIKAALFPMHTWLPDAHSTAPSPSSALLSGLVVKVYAFAVIKVIYQVIGIEIFESLGINTVITYFAAVSMIMGSIFALGQRDIKRMLAYSSVAQIGYIFLGISIGTKLGLAAALFHIISHALMKSALFLSVGSIIHQKNKRDVKDLDGIGYEMPLTMSVFTVCALGMIGVPGVSGFMSKWYLSLAVLDAGKSWILAVILLSSFLNAMYYLPIIISAFLKDSKERPNVMAKDNVPKTMLYSSAFLGAMALFIGIFPNVVMNVVTKAVEVFKF